MNLWRTLNIREDTLTKKRKSESSGWEVFLFTIALSIYLSFAALEFAEKRGWDKPLTTLIATLAAILISGLFYKGKIEEIIRNRS